MKKCKLTVFVSVHIYACLYLSQQQIYLYLHIYVHIDVFIDTKIFTSEYLLFYCVHRFFLQNDIDDYLSEEIIDFEIDNFKKTVKETQGITVTTKHRNAIIQEVCTYIYM
jgi:hypothetical protein